VVPTCVGLRQNSGVKEMTEVVRAILYGGVLCGVLDAIAATTSFKFQGVSAMRVWQSVASGALGDNAFRQGPKSAVFGLLMHLVIAFGAAGVFCLTALHVDFLLRSPVAAGVLYGIAVFLFMNLFVRRVSRVPKRPVTRTGVLSQVIIHMVFVGLPISLSAAHFLR
jgi:hypothetical protein